MRPVGRDSITMPYTDKDNGLTIDADFPCGSAGGIRKMGGDRYEILPKPEPVPDWFYEALRVNFGGAGVPCEYAFNVRLHAERATRASLRFHFSETNGNRYMDPPYWLRRNGRWWIINSQNVSFEPREHVDIDVDLFASETVYVANKPYVSPETVSAELAEIVREVEGFDIHLAGETAEGRPIEVLHTQPRDESILIHATMQPAEPAARPVLAVAHWLTDRSDLTERLRDRFQFCFVPMPNPDGAHHGRSVTNNRGEVPMFSFEHFLNGEGAPKETEALWRFAEGLQPTGFVEFHTHYQDTRPHKLNPLALEWFPEEVHDRVSYTDERLLSVNDAWRVTTIEKDTPLCRAGKFANLAERLGTITYCYQIYALTEEATCAHAITATRALAKGLAGPDWVVVKPPSKIEEG